VSRRTAAVLLTFLTLAICAMPIWLGGQDSQNNDEILRRAKSKVEPAYPELARKMHLGGTVRIEVVVAPNGTVKEAKVVGGHPVLAGAALDAAKKWRFEPAATENSGVIDFRFEPR
jgi:TonB family protein